jgi:autotransporter-associated beta strand protein
MSQKNRGLAAALYRARAFVITGFTTLIFAMSTHGTTWVWNGGGGTDGNWGNSANWFGLGTPNNGDSVVFQGATGLNTTNNIVGLTLGQIQFLSGGFNLYGLPFTLTNGIVAVNFFGTAAINNSFTNATADTTIMTSNSVTLTVFGNIRGAFGVVKTGLGTLTYNCLGDNTYTGTTLVSAGTLQLNAGGANAFGGPLVIGDGSGTGAPTVRDLQVQEIPDTAQVTVNLNGLLDLNNDNEIIGGLTMLGGTVSSGTGTLFENGNFTVLASSTQSLVTGNLSFNGGAMPVISVANGGASYTLNLLANVHDNGNGLFFTNSAANYGFMILGGSNTITGPIILNSLTVSPITSYSLGATNPVTVGGNGDLWLYLSGFTNKTLTLQAGATLTSQYNNTWTGPIVLGGNVTVQGSGGGSSGTLNLAGPITGTGNIAAMGDNGYWVLLLSGSQANTFAGDLSMQIGTLQFNKSPFDGAMPHNLFLGDATHSATNRLFANNQIGNNSTVTLNGGSVLDLNNFIDGIGSFVIYAGSVATGAGAVVMFSPGSIITPQPATGSANISGLLDLGVDCTIIATNDLNISAVVEGNANLIKNGPGNLHLQGANTYSGLTVIQQGLLWAENPLALGSPAAGTVVSNGASLVLAGNIGITNESLTLNGPGVGGVGVYGSLDVESGINYWAGPITNNTYSTLDAYDAGSELYINGPISGPGSLELFNDGPGGGTIFYGGVSANTYAGLTTVDSGCTLLLTNVGGINVPGNLVLAGNASAVHLGNSEVIANTSDVLVNAGALFDLSIYHETIDTLHGSGTVNFRLGSWITVGENNGSSEFDGSFTGLGYNLGGYTVGKDGSGTFTIGGNSTYAAGITHVMGGTLIINGAQPLIPVTVDAGTTLGGSGTVGPIAANGTVAPGNNSSGILNSSNVTFSAGGRYIVQLSGPNPGAGGYDQLNVVGTNTLANATLAIIPAFTTPVAVGQQFVIINNDLIDPITGIFNGLPEGSTFTVSNYKFAISYVGGTGNDVVLTLKSIPGAAVSSTVTAGDGSHGIDPNGCNNLSLAISNITSSALTGVTATLSTTTEGVVITQPYASYPNIPANGLRTNNDLFQISALPSFVCSTPINLQLSVNSSLGSFTMNYVLQTGETAAVPSQYDVTGNVAIPDVGSVDSINVVSGFTATPLDKVVVSLYITHQFDADLTNISLMSPDGTRVLLSSDNGGSGQNYGSGLTPSSNRTTFDDAAGTSITNGTAPFVGTFRPQSPLSAFVGNTTPNGNWHLQITDGFGGSLGTLRGWSLFLYGNACSTGSGACDYCLTSISGLVTNTSSLQSDNITKNGIPASCGAPKAYPGSSDLFSRHYNLYAFTNTSASEACVTVVLTSSGDLQAMVYTNTFHPLNIGLNYLADSGGSTSNNLSNPQSCSASILPGATFYVTINEVTPNAGGQYALQLSGLPCPPPTLNIQAIAPNQARLYWDTSAGGYVLQSVSNLMATAWGAVTNEPMVSGGNYNVTNSIAVPATNRFYRLQQP